MPAQGDPQFTFRRSPRRPDGNPHVTTPPQTSDTALRALVLLGGHVPDPAGLDGLGPVDLVVAADSGLDLAERLGVDVDIAVGDFDSASAGALARAEGDERVRVERHPAAKDATDFELALEAVSAAEMRSAVVVGGGGGRLDHLLANAMVMASDRFSSLELVAVDGDARLHVVRRPVRIRGTVGELVSLLAVHGPAEGVRTEGMLYPLHGERLEPGSTRGVSNRLTRADAEVSLDGGVLLAVLPGPGHGLDPIEPPTTGGTSS